MVPYTKREFQPDAKGILDGIRVIDLSRLVVGNFLTVRLADFGAEVIKIEAPGPGDPYRTWQDRLPLHWKEFSRNKKSITLNLRADEGRKILLDLVETADVLVENFRPGRLEEMGLGPDILLERNPKLIVARVSGFGQTGPYSSLGGFGTLVEGMSGFAARCGFEDREPVLPPIALADNIAGLTGAWSVTLALYHRDVQGGPGQVIDISLLEPIYSMLGPQASRYKTTGNIPKRVGSRAENSCPRNVYRTKDDRWVAMSASVQQMAHRLFRAIGREDMVTDPRYSTNAARCKHQEEVDGIVAAWIAARTLEENLEFFRDNEITVGPVYDISQIVEDRHFIEREVIVTIDDDELGELPVHNIFPRFSKSPGNFHRPAPKLGEHNEEILGELGYGPADLDALRERKTIG